jgi:hypothetical protein
MHENFNFSHIGTDQSAKPTDQVGLADLFSVMAKLARSTILVGQANSSKSAKPTSLWLARSIRLRSSQIGPT